jgi:hypothetical protein
MVIVLNLDNLVDEVIYCLSSVDDDVVNAQVFFFLHTLNVLG